MQTVPALLRRFASTWGAHPDPRKHPAASLAIERLPLPRRLHIPLRQHLGAPATPLVRVGQVVRKGELIGRSAGEVCAPVHATTSGRIIALDEVVAPHPSGLTAPAITLEADGNDEWLPREESGDPFALPPAAIAAQVRDAGIVGMGGATFPSAVKLQLAEQRKVARLVINGGECEPYLSCDDRLMRERADAVVDGARILRHATRAREVLIGIEDNKPEALAAMRKAAQPFGEVAIHRVPSRYPMGSEKQLVNTLLGTEVPAGSRPADVGVLVHNVATAYAVHRALRLGEPLVSRIVTVNGGAVAAPRNLEVPIGAPVRELFEHCGGFVEEPVRLVVGGPMMGQQLATADAPVVKGMSGVLALTRAEIAHPESTPCIRCATCVTACPMGLMPLEIAGYVRAGDLEHAADYGLADCMGCGCCAYLCPAHIPLVQYFDYAKGEIAAREHNRAKQASLQQMVKAREERLSREAREKAEAAAKRKAAKLAAAAAKPASGKAATSES
jgi:electron transport complex protein RnfC